MRKTGKAADVKLLNANILIREADLPITISVSAVRTGRRVRHQSARSGRLARPKPMRRTARVALGPKKKTKTRSTRAAAHRSAHRLSQPKNKTKVRLARAAAHRSVRPRQVAEMRPAQVNSNASTRWPNWPNPLDFQEVPAEEAVERVNRAGYFLHTKDGDIYKADQTGIAVQKPGRFNNVFACRQAKCGDGKLIPASRAWLRSRNHREYQHIGYWPENHARPPSSYNLWHGWGIEAIQGDWSPIYDHILNVIADGDQDRASYILDWCTHMVQRPWEKPGVALVLKGKKGTGKTLVTHILARLMGRQNVLITSDGRKLFERFNWPLADKLLIGAEEAFFSGDRLLNDKLKHLVTGDEIEVEQKFGHQISIKSMHRMVMTTNHANVIDLTSDERRFFVCDVSDKRRGDDAYFRPLWRAANGEMDAMLAAFMYELKTRDITDWRPERGARKSTNLHLARLRLVSPLQGRVPAYTRVLGARR
jgi:hypothetical protein